MAFIDLGDQFVGLSSESACAFRASKSAPSPEQRVEPRPEHRHFGLVVDDVDAVLAAARERGADIRGNNVGDPWGNRFDVVAYADVQFTKTDAVLRALGEDDLGKSGRALAELRAKGIEV